MTSAERPEFSVLVPSVGRAELLATCLGDLCTQDFAGRVEILVVLRPSDTATVDVVQRLAESSTVDIRGVPVGKPGFVYALRTGVTAARGTFVAFCDDDARYPTDWLSRLRRHFVDPAVGGVGGMIREGGRWQGTVDAARISSVSWLGRPQYSIRAQPLFHQPVPADMLPGANMCYRRHLLNSDVFDDTLDGAGYSPGNELAIAWSVRRQGARTLLDPTIVVDHYSAPWVDGRRGPSPERTYTYSRNIAYIMCTYMRGVRRMAFLAYFFSFGQRESPGLAVWAIRRLRSAAPHQRWLRVSMAGKVEGVRQAARPASRSRRSSQYKPRGAPQR